MGATPIFGSRGHGKNTKFHILANIVMLGVYIVVFEVAESIPGVYFKFRPISWGLGRATPISGPCDGVKNAIFHILANVVMLGV